MSRNRGGHGELHRQSAKRLENGRMSRRQLIQTIAMAATVYGVGEEAAHAAPSSGFKNDHG